MIPAARWRLILFAVLAALLVVLALMAGGAVMPFVVGLSVAYLIAPIVGRIEALLRLALRGLPRVLPAARPIAIVVTYLVVGAAVAGSVRLLAGPLMAELAALRQNAPTYLARGDALLQDAVDEYHQALPEAVRGALEGMLTTERLEAMVIEAVDVARGAAFQTLAALTRTVGFLLAMLIVPFWMFYILLDTGRVVRTAVQLVPPDLRPDVEALRIVFDRILSGYIRGQLIVAVTLGALFTATLLLLGVPYALVLGLLAGGLAIVPFVGTIVGAVPALVIAFLQSPELALQTLVGFALVQQVDNLFISPRVQGRAVALHPGVIMVVVVIGQAVLGPIGLLVSVPLAAMVRDLFRFLHLRLAEDALPPAEALARLGYGDWVNDVVAPGGRV